MFRSDGVIVRSKLIKIAYQLLNSIFGWNNTATRGTIAVYILYWAAVSIHLGYLKWKEGRVELFGRLSKTGRIRLERRTASSTTSPGAGASGGPVSSEST